MIESSASYPHQAASVLPARTADWQDCLVLAVSVLLLASATLYLTRQPGNLAHLWLADVVCTVYLLRFKRGQWPLLLLCSAAAEWLARYALGTPPLLALALLPAHMLQSLFCASLLPHKQRISGFTIQPAAALRLMLLCAILPPLAGALIEALVRQYIEGQSFINVLLASYIGSATGIFSFLPLMLLLVPGKLARSLGQIQWQQLIIMVTLCIAVSFVSQLYLAFPLSYSTAMLIVAALILPVLELTAVVWLTIFATCASLSLGFFIPPPITQFWQIGLIYLPLFMVMIPPLLLAVSMNQTRQRELARRAIADRMEAILRHAAEAIITSDENGVIESFNQAAVHIYQWPECEAIGKTLASIAGSAPALPGRAQGQPHEMMHCRRDGSQFPAEIIISCANVAGERKHITIVRDITERKRMDQLKTDFVSTVSHELRTPLTSIRGALGLLAGGVAGPLPEQADKLIRISHASTERLGRLINDLLDMQKLEAGKVQFHFAAHAVATMLHDAVSANQSFASQYGVKIEHERNLPDCLLWVDADRLQQVLSNLLSNACKFSNAGGVVEMKIEIRPENSVRISVIDHGSGIPDNFKEKIFQKFSQSDSSDTKLKGGTGLGLSIAQTIIEQMGGDLNYTSELGRGSVFFIDLPIHQPTSVTDTTEKPA